MASKAGEFELIARCFRPLASPGAPAFGLSDDAAVWTPPAGADLVFTKDAMVEAVHFLPDDAPDDVGRKLARINLSDLAAMGAKPVGYLLSVALPASRGIEWCELFARGLKQDQDEFDWRLFGGDTVSTPGPLTLSLTAIGSVPKGLALRRNGARAGDRIYVSGTLGDAMTGLLCLKGKLAGVSEASRNFLVRRYHCPSPRVALGQALAGVAHGEVHSAMDISDGIGGDLAHITETSGVGARVYLDKLPISAAAAEALALQPDILSTIRKGGDDYELLFTASKLDSATLRALEAAGHVTVTEIGEITEGGAVQFLDRGGQTVDIGGGYRHF